MRDDRAHWERRYSGKESGAPDAPSAFVVRHAELLRGRVLDIACGRGRNAIYLARRGLTVDAVDIALAGLLQARNTAAAEGLTLNLVQADLTRFALAAERYDAIINIRFLERRLFPEIVRALHPGGIVLFETFLIDQKDFGHPRNPDFLLQHGELRAAFATCEEIEYEEGLLQHESGEAFLARLIARKPFQS